MTMASSISTITYNGDGSNTEFDTTFPVWKDGSGDALIVVTITDAAGAVTTTTDYTTSDLADNKVRVTYPDTGDVLAVGETLTITRNMDFLQDVDLVNNTGFLAEVIELALDKLTAQDQQLREALDRSVKVSPGSDLDPDELVETLVGAATSAGLYATAAAGSADSAEASATAAAGSADSAEASAELAATFALTPMGAWEAGTYAAYSVVTHENKMWVANTETTDEPSESSDDWDLYLSPAFSSFLPHSYTLESATDTVDFSSFSPVINPLTEATDGIALFVGGLAQMYGSQWTISDEAIVLAEEQPTGTLLMVVTNPAVIGGDVVPAFSEHLYTTVSMGVTLDLSSFTPTLTLTDTDNPQIQLFINGLKQNSGDYTVTNTTTITLAEAVASGTVVEIDDFS